MQKKSNRGLRKSGMSRRRFLQVTAIGGATAAFLAACAVPDQPGSADTAAPAADAGAAPASGEPTPGGVMVWMGHQEVAGLSPDDEGATVQDVLIGNIHNSLVRYNEYNELDLVLAKSYEISEDGLTYTFQLHEGVPFHDGSEFTSADVKYTYEYYGNPDNGASIVGSFGAIDSIETPDDYTVIVNMADVDAASLSNWASTFIVPAAYHAEVGEDTYRTAPIGTGAFKLKEWRAAEYTELERFDDHFRGAPYLDGIRLDVVPEPSVRMIALQTGDAHATVWPLLVEDSIELEKDSENFTVYRTLANSIKHIPLNNQLPQLSDKRVRQAMMYALDRQRIIDDLWNGAAQISHSNLSPANAIYYNNDLPQYDFNPEKAAELLDEAGWVMGDDGVREKDGEKLTFTITTITGDQARRPIAELSQLMLADVGIDVQLAEAPVASILESMRNGSMDASLFNWTYGSTPEPDPYGNLHSEGGNNFNQFFNERMDELIEEGTQVVDPELRKPIYYEIQELFVEEVPALYLQFDEWMEIFSNSVKGLPEAPLTGEATFYRANEWWMEE